VPFLLKLLRFLNKHPNLVIVMGCLTIFFGGALFVAYQQSGERNIGKLFSALILGDPGLREEEKRFWDLNPNLEFLRSYSRTSMVSVRDRQSGRTAVLDRSILSDVRVLTPPCASAAAFLPEEVFPGASGMVCFALDKPDDPQHEYPYRFGASYAAPGKAQPVADFYQAFFRARGLEVSVFTQNVDAQVLECQKPGGDTLLRIAILNYAGDTRVFLAAPEAFLSSRQPR
jgi:hypothetical protein